jgi:hypothetical protein
MTALLLSSLLFAGCDHAKDLVEKGKKQAEDIQKSLETKTEAKTAADPAAAAEPASPAPASVPSALPAAAPPATATTPLPTVPTVDPAALIEAFLKDSPLGKTNATLQALGALPEEARAKVTECNLEGSVVSDVGFAEVAKFPSLIKLNLTACTRITDNGLAAIKDLKNLEVVIVERCSISDAGLVHLRNLSNLKILNLNQTAVTDVGFLKLSPTTLSHIEELYITSVKVDGSCFRRIPIGDSLRILVAGGSSIGLHLDNFKNHRNLEEVNLYSSQVNDTTIAALKGHTKLRILHLGTNGLTDVGARKLTGLTGLEDLTFRANPGISDKCLATFKPCTKLTHFGDKETMITLAGRNYVKKFAPNCTFDNQ